MESIQLQVGKMKSLTRFRGSQWKWLIKGFSSILISGLKSQGQSNVLGMN